MERGPSWHAFGSVNWPEIEAVAPPIATSFVIPALPVTLIAKHDRHIPANLRRPEVEDFYAVIHYVSDFYDCPGDQVRGWMAVQRLIHGVLVEEPGVAAPVVPAQPDAGGGTSSRPVAPAALVVPARIRWYTCGFETGAFAVPRFSPYNILWKLSDIRRPSLLNSYLGSESCALDPRPSNLRGVVSDRSPGFRQI